MATNERVINRSMRMTEHDGMHVFTKRLRLESRDSCYKVALYLSYLHIKFDDKTEGNRIPSILSGLPASKVKLTCKFGFICS